MSFPGFCCAGNATQEQITVCHALTRCYPCCRVGVVWAGLEAAVPVFRLPFVRSDKGRRAGNEVIHRLVTLCVLERQGAAESEFPNQRHKRDCTLSEVLPDSRLQ